MKRFISAVLIGGGLAGCLQAAPSPDYSNYGQVNSPINIDAVVFQNFGTFEINNVLNITNFATAGSSGAAATFTPFVTQDTLYFTNTGLMEGSPGFRFDTGTARTRHSALSFNNSGSIIGQDTPADIFLTVDPAGDSINYPIAAPEPSDIQVFASNIVNTGSLTVGNVGLLELSGSNVNVQGSSLSAGTVSEADPNDLTGQEDLFDATKTASYFVNPPQVYDLLWGVTNGDTFDVSTFVEPSFPPGTYSIELPTPPFTIRGDTGTFIEDTSGLSAYAFSSELNATNIFINVIFINTNFLDSNVTVNVGFSDVEIQPTVPGDADTAPNDGGIGGIVEFDATVPDAISGDMVTNSIYFLDSGAEITMAVSVNAAYVNGYGRPTSFEISTSLPFEFGAFNGFDGLFGLLGFGAEPTNIAFDPTLLNEPAGEFKNQTVTVDTAIYEAQVGRNPELLDGVYQPKLDTNFLEFTDSTNGFGFIDFSEFFIGGIGTGIDFPDPTNEPGRVEIYGNQVNLTNVRLRAEGVVTLDATNLSGTPLTKDWGNVNSDLNVAGGSMTVSNIFPVTFQRLRGDITAWSANWVNIQTNGVTNTIHYHVLWVQPDLRSSFLSSIRNLTLRPTNTVVQDGLRVIDNALFLASNLTFNSQVVLTQNAGSFYPTNVPDLKNFFIGNTNASLTVDDVIDLGFSTTVGHTPPLNRKYALQSITNFGTMSAAVPLLQSSNFENDGTILANNGAMVIEAASLGLGLDLTNASNSLIATGSITLSANSMGISNSYIFAGGSGGIGQGQLLLETTPAGQIGDSVLPLPGTNSALINFWQVTDGFSLPVLPTGSAADNDLFGTEITTIATNFTVALHTWAGLDMGANAGGFINNMTIGHLKLSRQSPGSVLHFTGAGAQNGMYVDYLELDTNSLSYSDYRDGLVIDPNLTIYFAACNVDPLKLQEVYTNRLVWVPSFAGPNSTVAVPYYNSSNVCLMNFNVATSPDISFFPPVPNSDNQPYVLNDPSNPTNFISCPTDMTLLRALAEGTLLHNFEVNSGGSNINLVISTMGSGSVSPHLEQSQIVAGKTYTLTATPAKGWAFSGWSASGLSGNANTGSSMLKFKLQNDIALTANFAPKTYTLAEGAYYGLFTNTSLESGNSGWFTFTLGGSGALSGRLLTGPADYKFSSTFPASGAAQFAAKSGSQSLNVTLNLDLANPTGQVTGKVIAENNAWEAQLLGYKAPDWTAKNPSPFEGHYTLVLANTKTSAAPIGDSYGSVKVTKNGVLTVAGGLADGNAFSQSVPVSVNGLWPFYTYAAKGNDFLLGWIAFQDDGAGGFTLGETNIFWSKPASSRDAYYPAGFTNRFGLSGSPYAVPGAGSSGLSLTDPAVILSGGGLLESLTNSVAYDGKVTYAGSNLTLSINAAAGSFSGRLESPGGGPGIKLSGVVLQNQDSAFGFFLGTNDESGIVLLQSQ